jgi:hypothetical protein
MLPSLESPFNGHCRSAANQTEMVKQWIATCQSRPRAVLAVCALLLAVQVGPWWYSSIDSASYLSMARSFAGSGKLSNLGSPLLWYSPGYSALISPLFLFAERPFMGIATLQLMLAVGLMLGVYRWAREVAPEAAIWIACLTVVNHGFWIHFRRPLSEVAFMCALAWAINFLRWLALRAPGVPNGTAFYGRLAAAAALTSLACVIRPVGVMLAPAIGVWSFRLAIAGQLSWSRAAITSMVIGMAAGLPVALFVHHERAAAEELNRRSYLDEFHEAAQSPLESYSRGVQLCISDIGRVCIPGLFKSHGTPGNWTDINMIVHLPFLLVVCCGWWRWCRRENDVFAWFVPFYVLLIAAHAMDTGARLLLPLLPALFVALWFGIEWIGAQRQYVAAACICLQVVVAGSYWLAVDLPRARRYEQIWPAVDEAVARIESDLGVVDAARIPGEVQLMLAVALDRPVVCREDQAPTARWSLTLAEQTAPKGFVPAFTANELTLWHREPHSIASR